MSSIALEEFKAVRRMIVRFVIVLLMVFIGLLTLAPGEMRIGTAVFPLPQFGSPSMAVQIFLGAKAMLIPSGVPVVALGPVSPFVAPIVIALLVALLVTFPNALFLVVRFLRPALRPAERRTLMRSLVPALALFYLGCALAYFVIIPETFALLYSFAEPMGVAPFFALDDFISSVFFLTISVGAAFLLPVGMAVSSHIGLIPRGFWLRHWRGAVVTAIIFSAVITPDGSGVTMAFLSVPLLGLYAVGALVAVRGGHADVIQ